MQGGGKEEVGSKLDLEMISQRIVKTEQPAVTHGKDRMPIYTVEETLEISVSQAPKVNKDIMVNITSQIVFTQTLKSLRMESI